MKIALLADIHSNYRALSAVLDALEGEACDEYIFLGDYVSDTPDPQKTMALLYETAGRHPCTFLRGNREDYMLRQQAIRSGRADGPRWHAGSASGNLCYTYERLTERDLEFFSAMQPQCVKTWEGLPGITFCHGSPESNRELLQLEAENTAAWLERMDTPVLVAGHTHHAGMMTRNGRLYVNPGSVGIAIGDPGIACYAILESTEKGGQIHWEATVTGVSFPRQELIREMFTSGLYEMAPWFINNNLLTLITGRDVTTELVDLAFRLKARHDGKDPVWPEIEEIWFSKAAETLGLPDYGPLWADGISLI